jgi:hypothetical protein
MLTNDFRTHVHYVPAEHGILLFRGIQLLKDHANQLYNQGFEKNDKDLMKMALVLWKDADECQHSQFKDYSVEHLAAACLSIVKTSKP